jgi:fumarate reductase flavoprotein subunit
MDIDLAIVGGGIAGLMAAVAAAEAGKRVVVLESKSEDRYLCATRVCGGVFHCALKDPRTPPAELESVILDVAGDVAHPELVRMLSRHALGAVRWLQAHGIRFLKASPEPWHAFVLAPPNLAKYGLNWEGRAGDVLLRTMEAQLIAHGGVLARGHRVESLIMESAACRGVRGTSMVGSFETRARAVLIADGGFASSLDMVGTYISPAPERVLQRNVRSGFGFGLRMAQAAGAAITPLDSFYGHIQSRSAMTNDRLWPYPWWDEVSVTGMVVGPDARRFCDEGYGGPAVANAIARLPDPLSAIAIWDEGIWTTAARSRHLAANPNMPRGGAEMHQADTIEALASKVGLDPTQLVEEVENYNAAIASGNFNPPRSSHRALPRAIATAPFYAAPLCAGITHTMGGIAIDEYCRVLAVSGGVIPGLYAAGASTGGIEGGRKVGYVGGLIKSSVTSLRAAEQVIGDRGIDIFSERTRAVEAVLA